MVSAAWSRQGSESPSCPTSAATAYAGRSQFERRPLDEPWVDRELRLVALRKSPRSAAVDALIEALKG